MKALLAPGAALWATDLTSQNTPRPARTPITREVEPGARPGQPGAQDGSSLDRVGYVG
jgi:hypothetical protein